MMKSIRKQIARTYDFTNGDAQRVVARTRPALTDAEAATYGHHLDDVEAAVQRSAHLNAQRKDPSLARYSDEAHAADARHDAAASSLAGLVNAMLASETTTDEQRELAEAVRGVFFERGLDAVVNVAFNEEAVNSPALLQVWEESEWPAKVGAVPMLEGYVAAFAEATRALQATVHELAASEVTYAQVREANAEANERLREFVWHVVGTMRGVSAESVARREVVLGAYLEMVERYRRKNTNGRSQAASAGGVGELDSDDVPEDSAGVPDGVDELVAVASE